MNNLIDNPQILVNQVVDSASYAGIEINNEVEAIFIPFKERFNNVRALLEELHGYCGHIYLMPSKEDDISSFKEEQNKRVDFLSFQQDNFVRFFNGLHTSHHKFINYNESWDLPIKRNYVLLYSRKKGYTRILLIDDDIRMLTLNKIKSGNNMLYRYIISGCFIQDSPDTSILGHLQRIIGEQIFPFLSGSFLFLRPFDVKGFFPNIYNEDWLFMLPHIIEHSICSFGNVCQIYSDPFTDPKKASFQEFGDIIADSLYTLIQIGKYEHRYDLEFWEEMIYERRNILKSLKQNPKCLCYQSIIDSAININCCIAPEDCLAFINDWEKDIVQWQCFLQKEIT